MACKCVIILSGASPVEKAALVTYWCKKHNKFKYIHEVAYDVMKDHGISREDMKASLKSPDKHDFLQLQHLILEEQNRCELAMRECSFISNGGGPDPLALTRALVSKEAAEKLAETPAAKACLKRYREYLVVVFCPLKNMMNDDVHLGVSSTDFTKFLRELLHKFRIPNIYIDVTDGKQRMAILEQALKGELPIDSTMLQEYPLCVPVMVPHRHSHLQTVSLRHLDITPNSVITSFSQGKTNRMVDRYGEERFVILCFHKKLPAKVVLNVLRHGLFIKGEEYHFVGCSSGGLKNRTCYMLRGTVEDVQAVWDECGAFSSINSASKRLKRIGLLFSAAKPTHVEVPKENVQEVEDITTIDGNFNFTDGCGKISERLARRILQGANVSLESHEIPSVLQIRYEGCKGVVVRDPSLTEVDLLIRKSMKKFQPGTKPFKEVWLCDHSRPYSYGHLNKQFIMLFSGLGIKDEVFLQKQREHFEHLESLTEDPTVAIQMLFWNNQPDVAARVVKCLTKQAFKADKFIQKQISHLQSKLIEKMEKLRLLVEKSRNVFGVCDSLQVLEYGECFFRPMIRGKPQTVCGKVTVAKNPCYLLGDVRVLKAVDKPHLEHLVDCIVFPTKGKRPHPSEIAGSDLDGDQYFVCWDEDLIVPCLKEPYDYPSVEAQPRNKITRDALLYHFAGQNKQSSAMGKIDAYYKYWADIKGVDCRECQFLGMLFSRSVDAAKTGDVVPIPYNLQPPKGSRSAVDESHPRTDPIAPSIRLPVWLRMEHAAMEKKQELCERVTKTLLTTDAESIPAVCEDFVCSLVQNDEINISEFEIFKFVQRWCCGQPWSDDEIADKLQKLSEHINFGMLTVDQQVQVIDAGIPIAFVTNALNKSLLLSTTMLEHFSLHAPHCGWRFYFRSSSSNFDWQHLLRAVQHFPESIVIFQLPDGITAALHFLTQLELGEHDLIAGSAIAYLFSTHFGYQLRHILGSQVSLFLDGEILQLYREKDVHKTFLWLRSEVPQPKRARGRRDYEDSDEEPLLDRISIDLTSFKRDIFIRHHPKVNKQNFRHLEVFVKGFGHEPAYLDIHVADQPTNLTPDEAIENEDLEELPSEDEEEKEEEKKEEIASEQEASNLNAALHEAAGKGNCSQYLLVVKLSLSKEDKDARKPEAIQESLQTLLMSLVSKYAHKGLAPNVAETLLDIITTVNHSFHSHSPTSCLQLLAGLSRLPCPQHPLLEQVLTTVLTNLHVKEISEYLHTVSNWKLWYFMPRATSHQIAKKLYKLCQSILSDTTDSVSELSLYSSDSVNCQAQVLKQLASSTEMNTSIDYQQVKKYTSHFAHLLLYHFLEEAADLRDPRVKRVDNSLEKLKAYDLKDPHQMGGDGDGGRQEANGEHSKEEETTKVWRVGFSSIRGITSRKFTIGTWVSISLMTRAQSSPNSSSIPPVALGSIVHVSRHPTDIVVDVSKPIPHCLRRSVHLGKGHWQLKLVGNVTVFTRAMKALGTLLDEQTRSTELIPLLVHPDAFPLSSCSSSETVPEADRVQSPMTSTPNTVQASSACTDEELFNPSQQSAIAAALKQRLTLIHGPPGTGKTHVACEIVRRICYQSTQKQCPSVLVTAETNMAVDNLTRQLLGLSIRVVRIGQGQISPDIYHASLVHQLEIKRMGLGKEKSSSPFPNTKLAREIIQAAEVVATTCSGAGDSVLKGLAFPFVLVDEATQATEPTSLIPIVQQCQQLTLIGDPQQLAPTLTSANKPPEEPSSDVPPPSQLAVTLFHRLRRVLPSFFLDKQHRMHPVLAEFPSQTFYEGRLKSAPSVAKQHPLNIPWINQDRPLVFIDVPACIDAHFSESRVGTSYKNDAEGEVVVEVIKSLINYQVSPLEIAVLTPYMGQVQCIRDKLSLHVKGVEVCTIDGFQGREKEIIIFSTVRSNHHGELGFTNDKYRMNVLLTRAKHAVIGVGCRVTLSAGSELWDKWLKHVSDSVISRDEFQAISTTGRSTAIGKDRDPQQHQGYRGGGLWGRGYRGGRARRWGRGDGGDRGSRGGVWDRDDGGDRGGRGRGGGRGDGGDSGGRGGGGYGEGRGGIGGRRGIGENRGPGGSRWGEESREKRGPGRNRWGERRRGQRSGAHN